ncbi:methylglutaconyl-CoA hydratase [Devosia sp. YR412]|uniref:enoyl-CoA hydratase/isomerase family protein n=1 Tax=Devosia sp. YR412 TaxID=1881030 RepID=UPI0008D5FC4F|nr:enoyl-CoA hydratase/isomerase family protein [Devosia sp. YR412]SEQ49132.1 methylglutaconyl-CoA hydratase [Devosia sp. YR412]
MSELEQGVLVDRRHGVATITLSHPERANALDPAEFHALANVLVELASEPDLVAVVLTGQGARAFCAGLNLRNAEAIQQDLSSQGPTGLSAALRASAALPVPLIGRINGACVAGGMGLLGACDQVVAVDTARFCLPEINHGIYPDVAMAGLHGRGASSVVRRLADSGAMIDSAAALDAGLVDSVVASAQLDGAVEDVLSSVRSGQMPARFSARRATDGAAHLARLEAADAAARSSTIRIVNS